MKFAEFEASVKKEYIEGVLKSFSPHMVYHREYQGHHHPGYEIGVDTNSCRFLFVCEEQSGVMISSLDSKFEDTHDNWFSLAKIVCFLANKPFDWETTYQNMPHDESLTQYLHALQKDAAPYLNQIVSMFSNRERISDWASRFENYQDEQFKLRYPNFYKEYMKRKRQQK